jgi:uncharacterized YigZ family protein
MIPDSFLTISKSTEGEFKDKGSKFIGFAFPVQDEEEAKNFLKLIRKEHHAAAHVCWAYKLGYNGENEKSSDDREPSGSAGRPILRTIHEKKITNVLVAVVRYFGGKLLGVPGLIHAYSQASLEALNLSNVVERHLYFSIFQPCEYAQQHEIIRLCKQNQLKFFPDNYSSIPGITFEVSSSQKMEIIESLEKSGFLSSIELKILVV